MTEPVRDLRRDIREKAEKNHESKKRYCCAEGCHDFFNVWEIKSEMLRAVAERNLPTTTYLCSKHSPTGEPDVEIKGQWQAPYSK